MFKLTSLRERIFISFFGLFVLLTSFLIGAFYYLNLNSGKNLLLILALVIGLFLLAAFQASKFLTEKIFLPLQVLIDSSQKISCGTFSQRLEEQEVKELAALTNSFNRMADEVTSKSKLLEEKIKEMSQIYDFHRLGNKISDSQELLQVLLNKTMEILQVEYGFLFLVDKEKKLTDVFTEKLGEQQLAVAKKGVLEKIKNNSLTRGMVFLLPSIQGNQGFICLPLYLQKQLIGIVGADDVITRRSFTQGPQTVLFLTLANQLTSFIERTNLYQALEKKLLQRKKELDALLKVSRIANENKALGEILKKIVQTTVKAMGADKGVIILWDEEEDKLIFQAYYGLNRSNLEDVNNLALEKLLLDIIKKGEPLLISNILQEEKSEWISNLIKQEVASIFMMPLWVKDKILGSIAIFSNNPRSYSEEEKELYQSLANQAAITIENSSLYDHLQQSYLDTIRALVRAIEAKDAYTKGHAERVARYANAIGLELGLTKEFLEKLEVAAILHDIGKIGIPEKVLAKPGKLSEEEFRIMKSHPLRGQQILQPVTFEQEIIDGIYYHHERLDGKGYPNGLKLEAIPLIARILAVADAFDAMTSNRPYRNSLPFDFALNELKSCRGTQFDSQVVDAFLTVWARQGEKMASA